MQLGAQAVFVGSGIFKSSDPAEAGPRDRRGDDALRPTPTIVAKVSRGLGDAMPRRGDRQPRREARRAGLVTAREAPGGRVEAQSCRGPCRATGGVAGEGRRARAAGRVSRARGGVRRARRRRHVRQAARAPGRASTRSCCRAASRPRSTSCSTRPGCASRCASALARRPARAGDLRRADRARSRGGRRAPGPAAARRDRRRRCAATGTGASATRSRPSSTVARPRRAARSRACSSARRWSSGTGAGVEVLAEHEGVPVFGRQGRDLVRFLPSRARGRPARCTSSSSVRWRDVGSFEVAFDQAQEGCGRRHARQAVRGADPPDRGRGARRAAVIPSRTRRCARWCRRRATTRCRSTRSSARSSAAPAKKRASPTRRSRTRATRRAALR